MGLQGVPGPTGAIGPAGPQGPQGPAGPPGGNDAAAVHIALAQCNGPCAGYHATNTWVNVAAHGYAWATHMNTSPGSFHHNGQGTITVHHAGLYMIKLYSMSIPQNDVAWTEAICPFLNGHADCFPNGAANAWEHGHKRGGSWHQHVATFVRPLDAGTTVGWGYHNYAALSYWAHDTFTALEIVRLK
jgi:hypothetical protein